MFCNILLLSVSDSTVNWHRNAWAISIYISITALYEIYQQKIHWSSSVRHGDVYLQGVLYSSIVRKQFNLETYFSFFLLKRKQINSGENVERKFFFPAPKSVNDLRIVILNNYKKTRFSSAQFGIIKSSSENYTMTTWTQSILDWVKKKMIPLRSFAFVNF